MRIEMCSFKKSLFLKFGELYVTVSLIVRCTLKNIINISESGNILKLMILQFQVVVFFFSLLVFHKIIMMISST